jgi:dihydroneopterin aldolase
MKMIMEMKNLLFHLYIGCRGLGDDERTRIQPIRFDITIRFTTLPKVFETQKLDNTVGYHDLYAALEQLATGQSWFLMESLALESFNLLKTLIPEDAKLEMQLTKLKPWMTPLSFDGITITLSDD